MVQNADLSMTVKQLSISLQNRQDRIRLTRGKVQQETWLTRGKNKPKKFLDGGFSAGNESKAGRLCIQTESMAAKVYTTTKTTKPSLTQDFFWFKAHKHAAYCCVHRWQVCLGFEELFHQIPHELCSFHQLKGDRVCLPPSLNRDGKLIQQHVCQKNC